MPTKVQFSVQTDPYTAIRLDALRIVAGVSRARIGERAWLEGGIDAMEEHYAARLKRLESVAKKYGYRPTQFVDAYAQNYQRRTYGPRLEELEEDVKLERPVLLPAPRQRA